MATSKRHKALKGILIAANLFVAVGVVASAYGGIVNPEKTVLPALMAMTFPGWLILAAIMAVADLLTFRRQAFIPLASVVMSLGPLLEYCPLNFVSYQPSEEQLKEGFTFMTYNTMAIMDETIDYPKKPTEKWLKDTLASGAVNKTISFIISSGADIVCLQEQRPIKVCPNLFFTQEQLDSLTAIYPYRTGVRGQDILSKFPIEPVELRQGGEVTGVFAGAVADIHGHRTLILCLHMQSIGLKPDDKELFVELTEGEVRGKKDAVRHQLISKLAHAFRLRAGQARLVREQIDSLGIENVVIGGDFNDIPDCYALREVRGHDFRNAYSRAALGPAITYHNARLWFRIDHILYRGDMRPVSCERGDVPYSDHYPLISRFVWNKPL